MDNHRLRHLFRQSSHFIKLSNPQSAKTQLSGKQWFIIVNDDSGTHFYLAHQGGFRKLSEAQYEELLTEN